MGTVKNVGVFSSSTYRKELFEELADLELSVVYFSDWKVLLNNTIYRFFIVDCKEDVYKIMGHRFDSVQIHWSVGAFEAIPYILSTCRIHKQINKHFRSSVAEQTTDNR
jgi:hypothetical protein